MEGYAEGALGTGLCRGASNGVISPSHRAAPGTRVWTYAEGVAVPTVALGIAMPMPTVKLCRGYVDR